jgi:tetratricopeptide (TPR) repeat protein
MDEGIFHFREALRIDPGLIFARKNLQLAMAKRDRGKKPDTTPQIPGLNSPINSADPAQHYQLGNKYKSEGDLDKAIAEYQKALSMQPAFMPAINNLALAYMSQQEYDKALPLYMQLIQLQPDNYIAYYNMACLHAKQEQIEESIDWLKQAVDRGFSDWAFLKDDNDLENIRETEYFKELTEHDYSIDQNK